MLTKQTEKEEHSMDFEVDEKSIVTKSVNMSKNNKNDNTDDVNIKKKSILTEEDLNNFNNSISYVSMIYTILHY